MSDSLLLLLTVGIAFLVAELAQKAKLQHISWSATIFVAFGFALGPNGFEVFSVENLHRFDLLLSLLIGVVGFLMGIEFRHATRARAFVAGSMISCFAIFALIAVLFSLLFAHQLPATTEDPTGLLVSLPWNWSGGHLRVLPEHLWMGFSLAAIFTVPSMISNEGLAKLFEAKGLGVPRLLQVSAIFEALGILFFGMILAAGRALGSSVHLNLTVTEWAVIASLSGLVCGLLFALFIGREFEANTLFLATLGAVMFSSGLGHVIGVSPLFVNLIFGYSIAVFSQRSLQIKRELDRLVRPLSILLFFFAGAYWTWDLKVILPILILYLVLRPVLFKVIPKFFLSRILDEREKVAATVGTALLTQDHVAIALALAFQQRFSDGGNYIISIAIVGMLVSQVLGPIWLRRWLVDQGSIELKG